MRFKLLSPAHLLSGKRECPLVLLSFLLVAVIFTWPLALHMHDGVLGGHGDPLLNTWILSWDAKAVFTHPTGLFQANIIYPSRDVLAYSEHLIVPGLAAAPIYFATRNPVLAYNAILLLGLAFTALSCYLLTKELTGSRWGGLAAGTLFAFCPYKIGRLAHIHVLLAPFMPLMILYLYRYLRDGERRNVVLFGLFFLLQSLSSWHYLAFCLLAAGMLWLWFALISRRREILPRLGYALVALLSALILLIPFALPYIWAHARLPDFQRTLTETEYYSASIGDFLRAPPENFLYGHILSPFSRGEVMPEGVLFPGFAVLLIALAGLFSRRRDKDDLPAFHPQNFRYGALYFLALALLGFLLSFGPKIGGLTNYFYTVPFHLGLFKMIRFSGRFYVLAALGLSVLAGFGVAKISLQASSRLKSVHAGRLAAAGMAALLFLECLSFNFTVYPVPAWGAVPDVYDWLARQGDVRIIELPASKLGEGAYRYDPWEMGYVPEDLLENMWKEGMLAYLSAYHWKKTANGYSGYLPFFYRRIMTEMQAFPSQRSVELLAGLDIDYVIWHWEWVPEDERPAYRSRLDPRYGLSSVADFGKAEVFSLMKIGRADASALEVDLACPRATADGEPFNISLMVRNAGSLPYISTCEEKHIARVSFSDSSGNVIGEQALSYRPPFYLSPNESGFLPLSPASPPPPGNYIIDVFCEDGPLAGNRVGAEIAVQSAPDMLGTGSLSASLEISAGSHAIVVSEPDGLLPVAIRIRNDGDILWRCRWDEKDPGGGYPFGLVYLEAIWGMDDQRVWEIVGAVLPCDVSPGQEIEVPVLVRPPDRAGNYVVAFTVLDKDLGRFGGICEVEVSISRTEEIVPVPQNAKRAERGE